MAAGNESQGLKIAVAAFVTLTVILAVTSYFLYTGYSRAEAVADSERDKASKAQEATNDIARINVTSSARLPGPASRSTTPPRPRSRPSSRRTSNG